MKKLIFTLILLSAPFLVYAHGDTEAEVAPNRQFMSGMMNYMAQLNFFTLITYLLVWIVLILLIAALFKWLFKRK